MDAPQLQSILIRYFKVFKDCEFLYFTTCGIIFHQEDLKKVLESVDIDQIQLVTRDEILRLNSQEFFVS